MFFIFSPSLWIHDEDNMIFGGTEDDDRNDTVIIKMGTMKIEIRFMKKKTVMMKNKVSFEIGLF